MDFEKFTEKSRGFMQKAQTLAMRKKHQSLEPEHMLRVMLNDEEGFIRKLIQAAEGDPDALSDEVAKSIAFHQIILKPSQTCCLMTLIIDYY